MYKFLLILLCSFPFTQDVCEGTCFSEQEVVNITNNIKELQFDLEKSNEINEETGKKYGKVKAAGILWGALSEEEQSKWK